MNYNKVNLYNKLMFNRIIKKMRYPKWNRALTMKYNHYKSRVLKVFALLPNKG